MNWMNVKSDKYDRQKLLRSHRYVPWKKLEFRWRGKNYNVDTKDDEESQVENLKNLISLSNKTLWHYKHMIWQLRGKPIGIDDPYNKKLDVPWKDHHKLIIDHNTMIILRWPTKIQWIAVRKKARVQQRVKNYRMNWMNAKSDKYDRQKILRPHTFEKTWIQM